MKDLISIIIPAYNAQDTIEKCIKSVEGENIEIIVVIDGATDNTLKICKDLKRYKENINIVEQENKGLLEARNTGIRNAKGDYIMFLDADDEYLENTISKIRELIKKYDKPDLIRFRYEKVPSGYTQYKYIEKSDEKIEKKDFQKIVYPMFLNGYMLNAAWTNCVKTGVIRNIKIEKNYICYGEDLIRNLEIFSNIDNVVFTNDVLYKYIYMENSITNSKSANKLFRNLEDAIEVYSLLHKYLNKWEMYNEHNIEIVNNRIKKECNRIIQIIKDL